MNVFPLVSIIMPTYNSQATITLALDSIASQASTAFPFEVLVVDGGSDDETREVAAKFGCRILNNEFRLPEFAKLLGISQARGRYAIFLDSDEVLVKSDSLQEKLRVMQEHVDVKNIITAGLKNPPGYPAINDYANRFGEPFSFFIYRLDGGDYVKSLKSRYRTHFEDDRILIIEFKEDDMLPICDGGGHCFDLSFLRRIADIRDPATIPSIFPIMARQTKKLAVIKNDYTMHYSNPTVGGYLKKVQWRIKNNVHGRTGTEGFANREKREPASLRFKKYLFIPYAFSLVAPLFDAIYLAISHRRFFFAVHFPLTIYTGVSIVYQYALKFARTAPKIISYGD